MQNSAYRSGCGDTLSSLYLGYHSDVGYPRDPISVTFCLYALFSSNCRALDDLSLRQMVHLLPTTCPWLDLFLGFLGIRSILGFNPLSREILAPSLCFFAANTVWTMIYDTIYACQDVVDDVHAGVKSMAAKFQNSTKLLTSILACVMTAFLAMTSILVKLGPLYYLSAVGGSAVSLAATISMVDLADSRSCGWWFSWGFLFVGGSILSGLAAESVGRSAAWSVEPKHNGSWIHPDL
jgi:hypothetical protein